MGVPRVRGTTKGSTVRRQAVDINSTKADTEIKFSKSAIAVLLGVAILGFVAIATCWLARDTWRRRKQARNRAVKRAKPVKEPETVVGFQKPELDGGTSVVLAEAMEKDMNELEAVEKERVELEVVEKVELEAPEKERIELEAEERSQEVAGAPTALRRIDTDGTLVELPGSPGSWA